MIKAWLAKINNSHGIQRISQNRTNSMITNTIKLDKNGYNITRRGKKKTKNLKNESEYRYNWSTRAVYSNR